MTYATDMALDPKARAPRARTLELHAPVFADRDAVKSMSPLEMLAFTVATAAHLRLYEAECVAAARKSGATWEEIGRVVGMPRQNAQRKYGQNVNQPT